MTSAERPGSVLLLSNSRNPHERPLEYAWDAVRRTIPQGALVAHIPYAAVIPTPSHDDVPRAVESLGARFVTVGDGPDAAATIESCDVMLAAGGNTFQLLRRLQQGGLIEPIRRAHAAGVPYIGISAGTNVACPTIATTNSMPITEVTSLRALDLVPFQINVHYPGPVLDREHMGESRDQRLQEYLHLSRRPIVALREGSFVLSDDAGIHLHGAPGGRLFTPGAPPVDIPPGTDLTWLRTSNSRAVPTSSQEGNH